MASRLSFATTKYSRVGRGVAVGTCVSVGVAEGVKVSVGVSVIVASGSSEVPRPKPRVARKVSPTAIIENSARIPSALGSESVTSGLDRRLFPLEVVLLKVAPHTEQRVLPSLFFVPQVGQVVGLGVSFSDFLAMESLLILSLQSRHYTSTWLEVVAGQES